MVAHVSASQLRAHLYGSEELALLDVREPGQIILGHILFSAPLPFSLFEARLPALVPNRGVRVVLCDDADGVAERAAARAEAMGYTDVSILAGGVAAWAGAGYTLYKGVNVPSKAFGELVEHAADTPRLSAEEVARRAAASESLVIVDGRPLEEFAKMNIPGAACCPNGELALRAAAIAPDPRTTIVVNCAGRTRSIIGAQTLIDVGVPNPVYAMENGTQGWVLAGLSLEHGAAGALPPIPEGLDDARARSRALAARHGVDEISPAVLTAWMGQGDRSLYLLDVRTEEERAADPDARRTSATGHGVVHAPGGQLVQATDQWIGVRRARIVILDVEGVRAPVVAAWLRRLGHDASTLVGGLDALQDVTEASSDGAYPLSRPAACSAADLAAWSVDGKAHVLDLRSSARYRAGHVPGAIWTVRPRLQPTPDAARVVLVADDAAVAGLLAEDLTKAGAPAVFLLEGGMTAWEAAGHPVEVTPDQPADADRIDFLSFTHGRHDGNLDASRAYLSWEIALVDQLDADERAVFQV